jgi:hypothetical protein
MPGMGIRYRVNVYQAVCCKARGSKTNQHMDVPYLRRQTEISIQLGSAKRGVDKALSR